MNEHTQQLQEKMEKQVKELVINNNQWITTRDIYCNDQIYLFQRYMTEKKVFWIDYQGKTLFPKYMFDQNHNPLPVIEKLIKVFSNRAKSFWSIAMWLESINSYFDGNSPKEFLISDPEKVVIVAIDSLTSPEHG